MSDWTGKTGYVAAGGLVGLANLTPNQWYMLIGTIIGVATLGVNIYYKHRTKVHQDKIREIRRNEKASKDHPEDCQEPR